MRCVFLRFALVWALWPIDARSAEKSLCKASEVIVFSCTFGRTAVSLCRPGGEARRLIYRYGSDTRLELVHDSKVAKNPSFVQSAQPLFGGGIDSVSFERGGFEYSLYAMLKRGDEREAGGERTPEFEDGLIVSRAGKAIQRKVCADGGGGFRESLDWLPQRRPAQE